MCHVGDMFRPSSDAKFPIPHGGSWALFFKPLSLLEFRNFGRFV
jgi:hypothetical protein